jgi:hypothetical protein
MRGGTVRDAGVAEKVLDRHSIPNECQRICECERRHCGLQRRSKAA